MLTGPSLSVLTAPGSQVQEPACPVPNWPPPPPPPPPPQQNSSSSGGSNNNNTGKKNCVYLIPSSTAITAAACFLYIVPARVASRKGRNSTRRCRRRTLTCRVPRYCINNMKHTLLVYDSSWTHGLNIVSLVLYTCFRERGRGE